MTIIVPLTFLLCGLCVLPCIHGVTREYHFVNLTKNWTEAQQHCREHYTDLATVTNMEEVNRLNRTGTNTGYAWIGLLEYPASWRGAMTSDSNDWRWSATGTTSTSHYQNWYQIVPYNVELKCTYVDSNYGFWSIGPCSNTYYFVCYRGLTDKVFYLVTTGSTWDAAVAYCRTHYTDLAVIETAAEDSQVVSLVASRGAAWIGLYREPWRWSDNTTSNFRNWGTWWWRADYSCVAEDTDHRWYPQTCDQRLPFFCHGIQTVQLQEVVPPPKKKSTAVKMNFRSALDMTDPRNYKLILEEIEKQLNKTGHSGVKVTFKTPPKKKKKTEL